MRGFLLIAVLALVGTCEAINWDAADAVLRAHIANHSFPGCVALVGDKTGILHQVALGNYTYGLAPPLNHNTNPPMKLDTIFDMASCTKVTMTTTAVAQFYQRGEVTLDDTIASILGDDFSVNGKAPITVLNCLLHNAGFYPDPIPGWADVSFGCPETKNFHPAEKFSCMDKIWSSFLNQKLNRGIGVSYVYSDLSYITLMFVVGELAQKFGHVHPSDLLESCASAPAGSPVLKQCYFEAYVRHHVISKAGMRNSGFLPHGEAILERIAPTCNDTKGYMHTTIQGVVQDSNTYAMGGISGHAGLFSTAEDVFKLSSKLMWAEEDSPYFNATTAKFWLKEYNHTQSSRAIGWNTNDPAVFDQGFSGTCGSLSTNTWMHTGYTGTLICGDQDRELIVILLTNRVYPNPDNTAIMDARREFTTAVQKIYDSHIGSL